MVGSAPRLVAAKSQVLFGELSDTMIELEDVGKRYGQSWALRNVSLQIAQGERVALIGPSGCGKSTLLRIIMGLITYDAGSVRILGELLTPRNVRSIRHQLGYVIQGGGLFPHLTVQQNAELAAEQLGWTREQRQARFHELAALVHLPPEFAARYPVQLSGGQQQRVGLIRALFLDPPLVLFDEPMGALDPLIRADLQHELREILVQLNKTMLIVTHDISEAGFLADSLVLLKAGQVIQRGSLADLVRRPSDEFVTRFINAQRSPLESIEVTS